MADYRELNPPPELADDVQCVWYDDRPQHTQLVVPDGCVDIVWIRGHEPIVAGPATLPMLTQIGPAAPVLGVRFRPAHAPVFLGAPAEALLNGTVPLRELWRDSATRLADALDATTSIADGLRTLQDAVAAARTALADPLVSAAVAELQRAPEVAVAELGDTLGISERQLLRRFTSAIGYGPRVFGRVLRFQRFMRLIEEPRTWGWDLARLAAETGYADHAHLTRECTRLAGRVPSALRPQRT